MSSREREELEYQALKRAELEAQEAASRDELIEMEFGLLRAIELGRECEQFWNSGVGRFVMDQAAATAQAAKEEMVGLRRVDFDSNDKFIAKVEDLQQQAHIPTLFFNWLNEAIRNANEAKAIYANETEAQNGN